jgi:predicted lipoprotein
MHDVVLPWQEEMNIPYGESLYLSAQDAGGAGEITVSITVNGRIVKDATSTGEFTIATVSDFCCRE